MWVNLIVSLVMMVVSAALQASMRPKPETPKPGKLDVPTASEGAPIPVVFGTVLIKSSNVIWYGDAGTQPIVSEGGGKK